VSLTATMISAPGNPGGEGGQTLCKRFPSAAIFLNAEITLL